MLFTVLYYDTSISEDELQEYEVEANDVLEAERLFKEFVNNRSGYDIYSIGSSTVGMVRKNENSKR